MKIISRNEAKALGLKRYFTGELCSRGHVAERHVSTKHCLNCDAERMHDYRREHPDRIAATEARRDKATRAAERRARRADGRDDYKTILKRSYRKHKAKRNAEMKVWNADPANKESKLAYMRSFKAMRRANPPIGMFDMNDVEQMYLDQAGECAGCGDMLTEHYHVDHVVPLARSGTNLPQNLELFCRLCNQSKGYKTWTEWRFNLHPW